MTSFEINDYVKRGLMLANIISNEIYKQILTISVNNLLHKINTPDFSSITNSKPDVIREFYACVLIFLTEASRHDLLPDSLEQYCIEALKYDEPRAEAMKSVYKINKKYISNQLKHISAILPHVIDVNWKLDLIIKTSEIDEIGGPIFRIRLCTHKNSDKCDNNLKYIDFKCNVLELTDLISKLKDIVRHCDKLASNTN